jgi:hypothetical protein
LNPSHHELQVHLQHIGSGKTRRMMEGLTKYWGFYFVAVPDANGVGVRDLQDTLKDFWYEEWMSDLRSLPPGERARQNEINSRIASKHLRKVLAARIVVFQLFLQLAIEVDGKILEKHKRIWLLFQLSDRLGPLQWNLPSICSDNHEASSPRFG